MECHLTGLGSVPMLFKIMSKRSSIRKKPGPADLNQLAKSIVDHATGNAIEVWLDSISNRPNSLPERIGCDLSRAPSEVFNEPIARTDAPAEHLPQIGGLLDLTATDFSLLATHLVNLMPLPTSAPTNKVDRKLPYLSR